METNKKNIKKLNKNSKALIVSNGIITDYNLILKIIKDEYKFGNDTLVIAADGGAKNCLNMKIIPDIIIGDMDSIAIKLIESFKLESKPVKFISSTHDKDESDTQLAVDYAVNLGVKHIIVAGALGGRLDHSFANLILLASNKYRNIDIKIITENFEIFVVRKPSIIKGEVGKKISIFSLTPFAFFESTSGLKYRLKNEKLCFSPVRGLSNEFTSKSVKLNITKGKILLFKEL